MTIANIITFTRLLISPIFLLIYLEHRLFGITEIFLPYLLLLLLMLSELSDALDGYLARKYQQVTDIGKVLDPLADSISRIAVLLAFTQDPIRLPLLLVFIFIYRDSVVTTLRTICALKGFALAARTSGKTKAILLATSQAVIVFLMIPHSMGFLSAENLQTTSTLLISIPAVYAIYSCIDYITANKSYIKKLWSPNRS